MTLQEISRRTIRGFGSRNDDDGRNDDDVSDVSTGDLVIGCLGVIVVIPLILFLYICVIIAIKNWH